MLRVQVRPYFKKEDLCSPHVKKTVRQRILPDSFLFSSPCNIILLDLIEQLRCFENKQQNLDAWYDSLCDCVHMELNKCSTRKSNRCGRIRKPYKSYWNQDLQTLWDNLRKAEYTFLRCRNKNLREGLKIEFKKRQSSFDKKLRTVKRSFHRGQSLHIDYLQTHNPQKFWNEINRLGPRKSGGVPMEVKLVNGECSSVLSVILQKWEEDFAGLFSGCKSSFDDDFLKEITIIKEVMEAKMKTDVDNCNMFLNANFSVAEVKNVVDKCKLKKATGIDEISNEVLKSPRLFNVLCELFQFCFDRGIIPTQWHKTIIKPIPKSSKNDPRLPLSYRGISLVSCVYKLYSSLLNHRLVDHLERTGLLVDEQNGFRKNRACIDHIYAVTSIIRARIKQNMSTFVCFIDFKKAFDWIDRELLQYRLLKCGVDGKFYYAIKSLYQAPAACVRVNEYTTGVKRGDVLSPTLFSIYVNDLSLQIKAPSLGVKVDDQIVSILLYADDVVLLAEQEKDLHIILNIVQ